MKDINNVDSNSSALEVCFQETLTKLRADHDKEVTRLSDDLLAKKASASRSLQSRLQKRDAVNNTAASANCVSVESFISSKRMCHSQLQQRLQSLIVYSKTLILSQKRAAAVLQGNDTSLSKKIVTSAQGMLLYSSLCENFNIGLKKKCLFEISSVKTLMATSSTPLSITLEDLNTLGSPKIVVDSLTEASDKIIVRLSRDIKSIFASLTSEKKCRSVELLEAGYSQQKVMEGELSLTENSVSAAISEVRQVMLILSAVWLDSNLLGAIDRQAMLEVIKVDSWNGIECVDDDDDETPSTSAKSKYNQQYGGMFQSWLISVLNLLTEFSVSMWNLKDILTRLQFEVNNDSVSINLFESNPFF